MSIRSIIKQKLKKFGCGENYKILRLQERILVVNAKILEHKNLQREFLEDLSDVEFTVFSQWGEDGIISWLVSRLPEIPKSFVEFGVENYRESNTRFLLCSRNWCGLVIDGSYENVTNIFSQEIYWRHSLKAKQAFIDKENINALLEEYEMTNEIGLLSIDIDGNDYWVWDAIETARPAIVTIEYNAVFGDLYPLTVPYCSDFQRTKAHYSNLYFGASLPALVALGKKKGYTFVGTTSTGVNAFFVRNDLASKITSVLKRVCAYPSKHREARNKKGNLVYLDGVSRAREIAQMPLIDLENNTMKTLDDFGAIYSVSWHQGERNCDF